MITLRPAFAKPMLCAVFLVRRLGFNSLNSGQRIKNQARQFLHARNRKDFQNFIHEFRKSIHADFIHEVKCKICKSQAQFLKSSRIFVD